MHCSVVLGIWLTVFHMEGCDPICSIKVGVYEGEDRGIIYNVDVVEATKNSVSTKLTFEVDGRDFSCEKCGFRYEYVGDSYVFDGCEDTECAPHLFQFVGERQNAYVGFFIVSDNPYCHMPRYFLIIDMKAIELSVIG
ncbi:hypothetical protein FOL47_007021 [Perkinsus chesapeaki]|uniref:Uncharacterized protein n=1 Tax=Perkinsus chesapeaki TaxID=330153 RepID=A0A7J6LNE0_PERCH|nr:hypothetical protein FOL47_007021 [Perkinsus chesapeaki]